MRDRTIELNSRRDNRTPSIERRTATVGAVGVAILLLCTSATPAVANVFGDLGNLYGCVVTWGQVCNLSHAVVGTGPAPASELIPVTCSTPLLNGLPQFLTWPEGQAKYRFQGNCSSPTMPGAVMTVRWLGTWNPSETKTDRPNASEMVEITGWEPFLPDRLAGGTIRMFWTARCTKDPWLRAQAIGKRAIISGGPNPFFVPASREPDGCTPFGAYVPDDLRQAIPDIDKHSFPRTGTILSAADRQRLNAEYERVNPSYFSRMGIQPRPLSNTFQAPIPPSTGSVPKPSAQLKIFSRGTEAAEQAQPEGQGPQEPSENVVPSRDEGGDDSLPLPQIAITFDQPLHFLSITGENTLVAAGVYEVEPVLDLQLSLAREGQPLVLLPVTLSTHSETIQQPVALLIAGESNDERHLMFLTPDGKRFGTIGSTSGVKSRGPEVAVALPSSKIKDAMLYSTTASSTGSRQPCQPNPLPVGPRWLPPGCVPGGIPGFPVTPPPPYLDGTNMLYACLNNNNGAFRIVRPPDGCVPNGEVKVKWQLAP